MHFIKYIHIKIRLLINFYFEFSSKKFDSRGNPKKSCKSPIVEKIMPDVIMPNNYLVKCQGIII